MNTLRRRLLRAGLAGVAAPAICKAAAAPAPRGVAAEEAALKAATGPDWAAWQGGPTPALNLPDLHGRTRSLNEFLDHVVLVTFWATWCSSCQQEIPVLSALADRYHDKGLRLVAVNTAEARARIDAFLARLPVHGLVLDDRNGIAMHDWHVVGMPANFVVDRSGTLRLWHLGELDWTRSAVLDPIAALL
ncbi:TlpA disulfide reductase family protein [Bordetella sp. FB-8]|uniref:TlpA family protein disulfide reductase n=1 Tax=Bordetella sp. FB-8 TaxID=1159870 RepID=UPI0003608986|nr:TlpA disulfide reductase family protein [Bordetella sp. FB-8]